ncbi:MAG TPA: putative Ig domain-containing protein [Terriglobales bacterium]|nr:putative Ig domain-containing protein [Terriglobales bacterium]
MRQRTIIQTWFGVLCLATIGLGGCGGYSTPKTTVTPVTPNANLLILSTSSTGHLPVAVANSPYAYGFLTNLGQPGVNAVAPVTFEPSPNLPAGMTLDSQGVLSGTPTQPGSYSINLNAIDSSPVPRRASAVFILEVRLPGSTLTEVAHSDLGGRGQNADVSVAVGSVSKIPYAYVGTRGSQGDCPATGVKIVDLSQIASPQVVASAGAVTGASQQEAQVALGVSTASFHPGTRGDLLAVTEQPCVAANATAAQTGVRFYDVTDAAHPALLGSWDSGVAGASDVAFVPVGSQLYVLVAVPNSETSGGEGDLRVVNITNPALPVEVGNWGVLKATQTQLPQAVMGQDQRVFLDSIKLSSDHKTAYLGYWDEGVVVLDVSDPTVIASNNGTIFLDHIIYPTTAAATTSTPSSPEGNTHQALPVVNDSELLVSDEVCASAMAPSPGNAGVNVPANPALKVVCGPQNAATLDLDHGWGFLRTYSLPTPGTATQQSFFATPQAESAPAPDQGIYTAHNMAWNGDPVHPHAYVAWFSSGVEDLDLTSISPPTLLANFDPPDTPDPNGTTPGVDNPAKAMVYGVAAYSLQGQPYILLSDINSGLWIVRETPTTGLTILTTTVPVGNVGVPYSATIAAINGALGNSQVTFSVQSGSNPLPSGLSIDSAGNITGTPLASGTVAVTISALDGAGDQTEQTLNFTINQNLAIVPPLQPVAAVNEPFTFTVTAANGLAPYTFSTVNSLPPGLQLAPSTGVVSGTPTASGTTTTVFKVTDTSAPPQSATLPVTITVAPLKVTDPTLADGQVGVAYAATILMTNGTGPFTPLLLSGTPPPGITVSQGPAPLIGFLIGGTPTAAGTYTFTVQITDNSGQVATQSFHMVVDPFEITPPVLLAGVEGRGYDQKLSAQGGVAPYTFNLVTGALPAGLTLSQFGEISGVPASGSAGNYPFSVQVTDSNGLVSTNNLLLVVFNGHSLAITNIALPPAQVGQAYTQQANADFGTPPYTFSIVGTLPNGLILAPDGEITGIPAAGTTGTFGFTINVVDAIGAKASRHFSLTVLSALSPK